MIVMPPYVIHSTFAVPVMRGVSFSSLMGPGVSARYSAMPPTPSKGRMATASTMMPRPPNQCSACRQRLIDGGNASSPVKTVEPVVVRPDMVSK